MFQLNLKNMEKEDVNGVLQRLKEYIEWSDPKSVKSIYYYIENFAKYHLDKLKSEK